MPNYLTLVIHVYPAKVSLRPVRLGNGLRPLPPSPAGLVATWHPAERGTGFSTGLAGPESAKTHAPLAVQHQTVRPTTPRPNDSHSRLTRPIPHVAVSHAGIHRTSQVKPLKKRHPSTSWSHPTSAQVYSTYAHSERHTPSPSRTLFQRS